MKKLIFIFFFPFFVIGQGAYLEFNAGLAYIPEVGLDISIFPGASFLVGKRFEKADGNFLLDMEIGLAFPTIATAKIGGGFYLNKEKKSAIIAGIRPWPLHLYTQINLPEGPKGQFILSFEVGSAIIRRRYESVYEYPLPDDDMWYRPYESLSAESQFIVNFGYRWNIGKNK